MSACSSKHQVFLAAFLLRLFLVFYGDLFSPPGVKYQDIDYEVFTNASRHIYDGGSAFDCDTYRYTPLLAWILQPNIFLTPHFGKLLFITLDIVGAYLLHHILTTHLQRIHFSYKINALMWLSSLWLFNPLIFTISSRGSSDSIIILLVLCTLYLLLQQHWYSAGFVYGLAVHFRIYPIIYALSFCLFITHLTLIRDRQHQANVLHQLSVPRLQILRAMLSNINVWSFGLMSLLSFMSLNAACFAFMGGQRYIDESYLYHFSRIDDQHNFSIYFYWLRLSKLHSYDSSAQIVHHCVNNPNGDLLAYCIAPFISRFSFIPQFAYIVIVSFVNYHNLHFALFLSTFVFVSFNKVCTSQYFIWYICLLPLVLPFLAPRQVIGWKQLCCGFRRSSGVRQWWYGMVLCVAIWFIGNANWLFWAYKYEILKQADKLVLVWVASLLFFGINNVLIIVIMESYDSYPLLLNYVKLKTKHKQKMKKKSNNKRKTISKKKEKEN